MGDRTYVRFAWSEAALSDPAKPMAAVYLHWGGDAKFFREVMEEFFEAVERDCERPSERRYSDPEYLAAKFVVHMASEFGDDADRRLAFSSVGICCISVADAVVTGAWTYGVICNKSPANNLRPVVVTDEVLVTDERAIAYHSITTLDEYIAAQLKNEEEANNA